jgi:putative transposase
MILTYKVKHEADFSVQLRQAKQVAKFAVANRDKLSSKYVAHIGLKSAIANQILREYGRNKNCKRVNNIKLIVPNQSIKFSDGVVSIPCLDFDFKFDKSCQKINQVEIDREWCYVSVTVEDEQQYPVEGWVGIDRNTTGHCAVAACTKTGKVLMLGKQANHVHQKYSKIRKKFQRLDKLRKLKASKRRESNITKDLNHKISRKVVDYAKQNKCGIKLEDLTGIRKPTRQVKSFKYALHSWAYYQLQQFVEYKAQLAGVPVVKIEPAYTSQRCHRCGQLGTRTDKLFKCPHCGYTAHADVNASWNVAYSEQLLVGPKSKCRPEFDCISFGMPYNQRLQQEGDCCKGNTDISLVALSQQAWTTTEPYAAEGGRQLVGGL